MISSSGLAQTFFKIGSAKDRNTETGENGLDGTHEDGHTGTGFDDVIFSTFQSILNPIESRLTEVQQSKIGIASRPEEQGSELPSVNRLHRVGKLNPRIQRPSLGDANVEIKTHCQLQINCGTSKSTDLEISVPTDLQKTEQAKLSNSSLNNCPSQTGVLRTDVRHLPMQTSGRKKMSDATGNQVLPRSIDNNHPATKPRVEACGIDEHYPATKPCVETYGIDPHHPARKGRFKKVPTGNQKSSFFDHREEGLDTRIRPFIHKTALEEFVEQPQVRNKNPEFMRTNLTLQDTEKAAPVAPPNHVADKSNTEKSSTFSRFVPLSQSTSPNSVMDQLVDKAAIRSLQNRSEIKIQLKPEFFGNVRMTITTQKEKVTVRIVTDQTIVKDTIESNLQQLKVELKNHGLTIDKFDVSVNPDADQQLGRDQFSQLFRDHSSQNGRQQNDGHDPEKGGRQGRKNAQDDQPQRDRERHTPTQRDRVDHFA